MTKQRMAGLSQSVRQQLTKLHRHTNGVIDIATTAELLDVDRYRASKLLAHLTTQGWVRRLRRGLYLLIPLEASSPSSWTADPWIIANKLFLPGYIAGWSASEHWGFTEQIFRDVCVFTSSSIRSRSIVIDQITYVLRRIAVQKIFGILGVWRDGTKIPISDPTRTVVDILDVPKWGGGIRHASHIYRAYIRSEYYDEKMIEEYLIKLGRSAAAKRFGYLWELMEAPESELLNRLQFLVTNGYSLLDPSVAPRGPYVSRWKLRVNVRLDRDDQSS